MVLGVLSAGDGTRLVLVGVSESHPGGHFGYLVEMIVTLDASIPDDPRVAALLEQRQPTGLKTP